VDETAESACHELLLRLAGRLSDRQLWRFRDWLAAGALPELSHVLPLTLLRERIGLVDTEFRLVNIALRAYGADFGLLASIREIDDLSQSPYAFSEREPGGAARPGLGDQFAVLLAALLRGRAGVGEVRSTWRRPAGVGQGQATPDAKRVLLVHVATISAAALAGELQRVQRALGEAEPCVEVLPDGFAPTPYHRAALAAGELLCTGAEERHGQLVHS
jgi:hypothetical protein